MFFSDSKDKSVGAPIRRIARVQRALLALTVGTATILAAGCAASTSSATARNAAGVECFSAGRYDDAIACFQESLDENPSNAEAYYNLASAYQRKAAETGDMVLLGQAEDAYWTALENNPNSDTIVCCYRGLATSAMARGDANAALQTLEAWRDRNPDSIEPKLEIAYLLEAQQKDSEAYDVLKQVAAEAPNDYRAFYKMGVLAERAGDLTDAMENAETAHKLNPSDTIVAQRMNSLEAQYAAKQRSEQTATATQKTAVAKAEFVDVPVVADATPVQTTPVQTTSAKAQENDAAPAEEHELVIPEEQPAPTTDFRPVPTIESQVAQNRLPQITPDPEKDASLGFGSPVASGAQGATEATTTNLERSVARKNDDSDVKWISSATADRVRSMIAQTGATSPQSAANSSGFPVVNSDGTGSSSQKLPNKTVTTAQFETPAFAAAATSAANTASAASTSQPSAPQASNTTPQIASTPAPAKEVAKPRAELRSGPPRVSAGSFF